MKELEFWQDLLSEKDCNKFVFVGPVGIEHLALWSIMMNSISKSQASVALVKNNFSLTSLRFVKENSGIDYDDPQEDDGKYLENLNAVQKYNMVESIVYNGNVQDMLKVAKSYINLGCKYIFIEKFYCDNKEELYSLLDKFKDLDNAKIIINCNFKCKDMKLEKQGFTFVCMADMQHIKDYTMKIDLLIQGKQVKQENCVINYKKIQIC